MKRFPTLTVRNLSAGVLTLALAFAGCDPKASPAPTPTLIQEIGDRASSADRTLAATKPLVEKLTPGNVEATKGTIGAKIDDARGDVKEIIAKVPEAKKAAEADKAAVVKLQNQVVKKDQQIAAAKKSDPVKGWLEFVGVSLIAAGVAGLIASFWLAIVRPFAAAALACGLALSTIAWYLGPIRLAFLILLGLGLVAGIVYLAMHWRQYYATLEDVTHGAGTTPISASAGVGQAVPAPVVLSAGQVTGPAAAVEDER